MPAGLSTPHPFWRTPELVVAIRGGETVRMARIGNTGRTLAEHSEHLVTIREQKRTAFRNIDSLADAVGLPEDR